MRILWLVEGCSFTDKPDTTGFAARHEAAIRAHLDEDHRLGIAFMSDTPEQSPVQKDNITYFPLQASMKVDTIPAEWEKTEEKLLAVIRDFKPDIIQCFGAEWPYGAIAEHIDIPVVILLMGFLNVYYPSIEMARGYRPDQNSFRRRIRSNVRKLLSSDKRKGSETPTLEQNSASERHVMEVNHYFFGRTDWDKNIARYYSPGSKYFHIPEAVKSFFYNTDHQWEYHFDGKLHLFTMSSGDDRKGNEIILRTAEVLKNILKLDFVWEIAGHPEFFSYFEKKTGISAEDVNIRLVGMIDDKSILDHFEKADLFIHPSIMDNSPHAICEAQLIGLPVLSSNVGGIPQLIEDGKTGFLYPYNEPHTLAFLIGNIFEDHDLLTQISENSRTMAHIRHDPDAIAGAMFQAYEEIIKDHGDRR